MKGSKNFKNTPEGEKQRQRRAIFDNFLAKISTAKYTAAQESIIKKYTSMRVERFNKLLKPSQIIDYICLGRNSSAVQWKMPDYISVIWLASKIAETNKIINYQIFEFSPQEYETMDKIMGWKIGESQSMLNCLKTKPYSTKWKKYQFLELVKIYREESVKNSQINWKQIADRLSVVNKFPSAMYRCEYQCQLKWKQASLAGNKMILNQNVSNRLRKFTNRIAALGAKGRQAAFLINNNLKNNLGQQKNGQAGQGANSPTEEDIKQHQAQHCHFTVAKLEQQVEYLKNVLKRLKIIYKEQYEEAQMRSNKMKVYAEGEKTQERQKFYLDSQESEESEADGLIFYA